MVRIKPEDVLAAYEKTGYYAQPGHIMPTVGRKCTFCCGVGVLAAVAGITSKSKVSDLYVWADETYGAKYISGFFHGFDGVPMSTYQAMFPEYETGYKDGKAAGKLCFEKRAAKF